jgi:hypothetical protein
LQKDRVPAKEKNALIGIEFIRTAACKELLRSWFEHRIASGKGYFEPQETKSPGRLIKGGGKLGSHAENPFNISIAFAASCCRTNK